jgi:GT2 family glycosyltransferase
LLDLTIIIPNFETRELLRQCIQSIFDNTKGISFEVICIDDNSRDGSPNMVQASFPEVILIRNQVAQYYAKNNNIGLRMSNARYACLLNSDTKIIGNSFEALVNFMDTHPDAAACGPKLLNPDMTIQSCIRGFVGLRTMILQGINAHKLFPSGKVAREYYCVDFDYSKEAIVDSIGTTAYVIRRSTWEHIGMLDEQFPLYQVDLAYNLTLKRAGLRLYYTPCAEVVHLGGQSVNKMPEKHIVQFHRALIDFNEHFNYYGSSWLSKRLVRFAVNLRCWVKLLELRVGSDKRVIKGPGAPKLEI